MKQQFTWMSKMENVNSNVSLEWCMMTQKLLVLVNVSQVMRLIKDANLAQVAFLVAQDAKKILNSHKFLLYQTFYCRMTNTYSAALALVKATKQVASSTKIITPNAFHARKCTQVA
jgi:hypothetical protein